MNLLLFNLATDSEDPALGFTTAWIRALASRMEHVCVVTMRAGRVEVPGNVRVYSLGKEKGWSEARRLVEFYWILNRVLRHYPMDVCFSHMAPIFTVLAAPILKARGIPIVTWYAHPSVTWTLRAAHRLSDRMVTSLPTTYPYHRDRLVVLGQGIDTDLFTPADVFTSEDQPVILCVGRLSPVKDHPTLIRAAAILQRHSRQRFRIVLLGQPATSSDRAYLSSLHALTDELGLREVIHFEPAVTASQLPGWYHRSIVHVNLTPTGSGDKVAWEAMACGRPCLAANEGFKETLGKYVGDLLFRYGDSDDLAKKLTVLMGLSYQERAQMGAYLRDQVLVAHSLDRLANNLSGLLGRTARRHG